ncbi:hypothetical protein LSUE1_G001372 [Lachnellula suecica]|uniref:Heterokaryon incompatibility domain-containing protein n=1 Tax=Lachnellula suecica TaxID=602035 RepID=A0A8T9CFU3_9HELO|nr:hypothetical protein LSUE1_G001372 [Lachnellula suecica]
MNFTPTLNERQSHVGLVNRSTTTDRSWNLAKSWLEECFTSHEQCHKLLMQRKLPARLIDVGDENRSPKLVLSAEILNKTRYLTLSHCWGGKTTTALKLNNLEAFRKKIPLESLSKTFQEAITTAQKLGYHYLWIDALCIIQDDAKDWKHETSLMGNIYANSDLNLAASDSPDGATGLFFNRPEHKILGWKVDCGVEANSFRTESWDCTPQRWRWSAFGNNILNSRAWTFQERLLARRTLCFGADEISWECRTVGLSETFPQSVQDALQTLPGTVSVAKRTPFAGEVTPDLTLEWFEIVTGYSAGNLTFAKDKLVAISGVARLFAERFGRTYVAGMWKEDLLPQLTWFVPVTNRSPEAEQRHVFRAPSWSWASIDSQVLLPDALKFQGSCEYCVVIEEVSMVPSEDPFADFKGGFLRLRSRQRLTCGFVVQSNEMEGQGFTMVVFGKSISNSAVFPDLPHHAVGAHVFYLSLLVTTEESKDPWLVGLVLKELDSTSFSRIGSFRIRGAKEIDMFLSIQGARGCEDDHKWAEKVGTDEMGRSVSIVKIV